MTGQDCRRVNRDLLPAHAYKTYQIAAPRSTHFRRATCAEVGCINHANGFKVPVDETTELGQRQAYYIRHDRTRSYTEYRGEVAGETGLTVFQFPAGTVCFAQHQMRLDRPELFLVRLGDHRGNPTGERPYQHSRPELWVEDFAEHQQKLADHQERG